MYNMINYLPTFMRKSKVYQEVFDTEGQQFQLLETNIIDIQNQLNVDTATWGLILYEKELKIKTDLSKSLSDRRSVIKSKLRGTGKVNAMLIKIVADAYTNGEVIVFFNGHIVIKFTSQMGIPPNLDDLKNALEDIKPAHLDIIYEFRYLTIGDISIMTIEQMQNTTLDNFAGGV